MQNVVLIYEDGKVLMLIALQQILVSYGRITEALAAP